MYFRRHAIICPFRQMGLEGSVSRTCAAAKRAGPKWAFFSKYLYSPQVPLAFPNTSPSFLCWAFLYENNNTVSICQQFKVGNRHRSFLSFPHFPASDPPILQFSSPIFSGSIFPTPIYTLTMKLASILLFLLVCLATPIPANLKLKANTASLSNKPVDK